MPKTKFLVRFLNRAARFDGDLELVDVVSLAVSEGVLHQPADKKVFALVHAKRHPRLAKQKASSHNRRLLISHLKATVYSGFLKDLYEELQEYVASLLASAAKRGLDPARLVGEHRFEIEANELLACGSWDAVVALASRKLFRRLEGERSTRKLLEAVSNKLALNVSPILIAAALPYFDVRHLLVHSDGKADAAFVRAHPSFGAIEGRDLNIGWKLADDARRHIVALVIHYDAMAVAVGCVALSDLQPTPPRKKPAHAVR